MTAPVELPSGTVTFLFTDIEGSTRLLKQLGGRYVEALAHPRQVLRTAFEDHGGHEFGTAGDAMFVAFRRARDAVAAAAGGQLALAGQRWPGGAELRVRMGLHTGEPDVDEANYAGLGVHKAAGISTAGHGGQVLLSSTTRELVADDLPESLTLRASGIRLRREALSGADALTPSEQRIADMAATGLANADIAQELFLTVKTVEMHLTAAYRKLDIRRRSELAEALGSKPRGTVQGFPRRIAASGRSPLRPCSIQRRHLRPPAAHDRPALSRPRRALRLPMLPHGARAFSRRWATPLHWASCSRRTSSRRREAGRPLSYVGAAS